MHTVKSLGSASRWLSQPSYSPRSVCVFCQLRDQKPVRHFSQPAVKASPTLPAQGSHGAETDTHTQTGEDHGGDEGSGIIPGLAHDDQSKGDEQRDPSSRRFAITPEQQISRRRRRLENATRLRRDKMQTRNQEKFNKMQQLLARGDDSYQPAEDALGLSRTGPIYEIDHVSRFNPYARPSQDTEGPAIDAQTLHTAAAYRALVETFAAVANDQDPVPPSSYRSDVIFDETQYVKVEVTRPRDSEGSGAIQLKFPNELIERKILRAGKPGVFPTKEAAEVDGKTAAPIVTGWGRQWLHASIVDPRIKLGVVKRFTYLTGRRVPDPIIHKANTIFQLLADVTIPQAPKKVYEAIQRKDEPTADLKGRKPAATPAPSMLSLPNVSVRKQRETYKQKEKSIGRWKLIRHELERRGLPVHSPKSTRI